MVGRWWCKPLFPALGRQRQLRFLEFEASLVYQASSKTVRAVLKKAKNKKKNKQKVVKDVKI